MKSICVLGLGYIGLPTSALFATRGHSVLGVDISPSVVDTINRGAIHIEEPGLQEVVEEAVRSGKLTASLQPASSDVFIIAVPTPNIDKPDGTRGAGLEAVRSATRAICPVVKAGDLIILESTSPPGTTRDIVGRILQEETSLVPGRDIFVAHCPERVLPGQILRELVENDRVVGGVTPACGEAAAALYRSIVTGQVFTCEATTAEMVKLMENTYRDVNIALANELALIAERMGFDANEVIDLANRHPRVHLHRPGPGVGGHCISVDPWFVVEASPQEARLIRLARDINHGRPAQVATYLAGKLGTLSGKRVAVLGVAYKADVDDVRESPITELIADLQHRGAVVAVHDPHVVAYDYPLVSLDEAVRAADLVLVAVGHREFRFLDPTQVQPLVAQPVVYDAQGCLQESAWRDAGFTYWRVGRR